MFTTNIPIVYTLFFGLRGVGIHNVISKSYHMSVFITLISRKICDKNFDVMFSIIKFREWLKWLDLLIFILRMKVPRPSAPSRRSQRLQRIDPDGQPLPELPVAEPVVYEHVRTQEYNYCPDTYMHVYRNIINWLFMVLRPAQEFFTYIPLPVKGCKI
jgi:hypothetical protein